MRISIKKYNLLKIFIFFIYIITIKLFSAEVEFSSQFGTVFSDAANDIVTDNNGFVYVVGSIGDSIGMSDGFIRKYDNLGNYIWGKKFDSQNSDMSYSVITDSQGNVYVTGLTYGTLYGTSTFTGNGNIFLCKYNNNGLLLWIKQFNSTYIDKVSSMILDSNGNIFITGSTNGNINNQTSSGGWDAFICKYDNTGNMIWTKQFGTSADEQSNGILLDDSGNIYVTGNTGGKLSNQTSFGGWDAFICKYDNSGNELWTKQFGTSENDYSNTITKDSLGNIFIAGYSSGVMEWPSNGGFDGFVKKYNDLGSELWTKQFGSSKDDIATGAVTNNSGNIFIVGYTSGVISGQTTIGCVDGFIKNYDSSGKEIWIKQFGTPADDNIYNITIDSTGNRLYICGATKGTFEGQVASGDNDAFIRKIFIIPPPFISVNPAILYFNKVVIGQSKSLIFTIKDIAYTKSLLEKNSGNLSGTISTDQTWIKINPTTFNGDLTDITVIINTQGNPKGQYTGNLNIISNGDNTSVEVRVSATCVIPSPNPLNISSNKKLIFRGTGVPGGKIMIYNLSCERIKEIIETKGSEELEWDCRTDNGNYIEPGMYFYTAKNEEEPEGNKGYFTVIK